MKSSSAQKKAGALAADGNIQDLKSRLVEAAAGREIPDHQMDMVDETAAMKFLGRHA